MYKEPQRQVKNRRRVCLFGSVVSQYDYTSDALGRRTEIARSGSRMSETRTDVYGYNARDELISSRRDAEDAEQDYAYQYDDIGNRITSLDLGTNRTYLANNLNQYTAISNAAASALSAGAEFLPQYDLDGNQTLVQTATGVWQVQYNAENRPVVWTRAADGKAIEMLFDRMGRRVEYVASLNGVTQTHHRFVYDGYLCIQRLNASANNQIELSFAWDPTEPVATRPLVMQRNGGWNFFYTHDGNKNVSDVVSFQQARGVPAHYEYAPFGAVTAVVTNTAITAFNVAATNPFRFSSEYADDALGLVYYNYCHYEPMMGRWLSRDPMDENMSANLTAFVSNRVLLETDRLGLLISSGSSVTGYVAYYGEAHPTPRSRCPCGKDLVYISDSGERDNGGERKARRTLFGSDGTNHSFIDAGSFDPNSNLQDGECVCDLIVAMHGGAGSDTASAGAIGHEMHENDILSHEISDMFVGIRFCDDCTIDIRACELGKYEGLLKRIANNTKCIVKAYKTNVHPGGPTWWDKLVGGESNPEVVVPPTR